MIQVTVLLSNSKNVFQKPHIQILLENQFYKIEKTSLNLSFNNFTQKERRYMLRS